MGIRCTFNIQGEDGGVFTAEQLKLLEEAIDSVARDFEEELDEELATGSLPDKAEPDPNGGQM
jgi:hypothetical protein